MQEAFGKALRKLKDDSDKPVDLELTVEVSKSALRTAQMQLQRAGRTLRQQGLEQIYQGYFHTGRCWQVLRLLMPAEMNGRNFMTEEDTRTSWTILQRKGKDINLTPEEGSLALGSLTAGMDLTEKLDGAQGLYRLYYVQIVSSEEAMAFKTKAMIDEAPRYSPAADTLMVAVTDLANMNPDQITNFFRFMYNDQRGTAAIDLKGTERIMSEYLTSTLA